MRRAGSAVLAMLAGCGLAGFGLAACGGGAAGWNATDACALMPGEKVGQLLGSRVSEARLELIREGDDPFSQCIYNLADGRLAVVGTGVDQGGTANDQVERARREFRSVGFGAADLPGVGEGAVWGAKMNSLYVALGGGRYVRVSLTQFGNPGLPSQQGAAMRLAKALGA